MTTQDEKFANIFSFVSYANADQSRVELYYEELKRKGHKLWMDCHDLKPGQDWDFEIKKALDRATIIILFISNNSVNKRGYLQKEIRAALDKYKEKLYDDVYLIPVVIDDVDVPDAIKSVQAVFEKNGDAIESISSAINDQIERIDNAVVKVQESHNLSWSLIRHKDSYEGLPGYEAEYQFIQINSSENLRLDEINRVIRGDLVRNLLISRQMLFEQNSEYFNFGMTKGERTSTFDAYCAGVHLVRNVISVEYTLHSYRSGARRGYVDFRTYVFILDPVVIIDTLENIFSDSKLGLISLQDCVKSELKAMESGSDNKDSLHFDEDMIALGTENWEHFSKFLFTKDGLVILFPPYQVAAWLHGPQRVTIKWEMLKSLMRPHFLSAIGDEYLYISDAPSAAESSSA